MKDDEKIVDYIQRVDGMVNTIRELGEDISDEFIVKKVLSSHIQVQTRVSAIEEAKDPKLFSMDELFGSLTAYEMRTSSEGTSKKDPAFNSIKKGKEEIIHE